MRFNSPPNWPPAPPGWTPPPDWRPDPSWPPPPPGWQLWVDDTPPSNKKGLIIGGIAAALVVIIGVVLAIAIFSKDSPEVTVSKPTTTTHSKADDEDEIKDVVKDYESAWNDEDFDGFEPIVCEKIKDDEEFNETDFLKARQRNGEYDLVVKDVDVNDDKATASVENGNNSPDDIDFVREDGKWKWCDV
jgi:major membrane immunogen (membrane-anchored lipoprotein)